MKLLKRCLRHLWLDADDARQALGEPGIGRLEGRVGASERKHTGQICLCVEASLPPSYLWRHIARGESIEDVTRDRAVTLFGKQRVWDTEYNNGVLIYLLLAEHRIEVVADRALVRCTNEQQWCALVDRVAEACRAGHIEEGLSIAVDALDAALTEHFPRPQGSDTALSIEPGLPDRPTIR
jgi:uncharacterized membrane protein